ncbi:hypothetical protein HZC27_01375 [Candidatus Roizmanbacteria bacterium]|nr:hypothetical protein [Candidatus Roizmanbacteria bacterium]
MYCVSKKNVTISGFIVLILLLAFIVNLITQNKVNSFRSKAAPNSFCESVGLYSVEGGWVNNYFNLNCVKNAPIWNGEKGNKAKCFTATALCSKYPGCNSTDCLLNINKDTKCINEPIDMEKCLSANAVTRAQLSEYECMYNSQIVTDVSSPYYYSDSLTQTLGAQTPVNSTYKCIKSNGLNVGTRCITDNAGNIIANYNMSDETHCPLNAPQILVTASPTNPATTSSPSQPVDTQAPAQPQQLNCDINKFGDYNCGVEGWYINKCEKDSNGVVRICGCDPENTWITYPILYTPKRLTECPSN